MPDLRLSVVQVRKRFGPTLALDGVDLEVRPGEVHAIIGENGAGKSTLLKILSGAYQPDAGTMLLDGSPYSPRRPADGRRAGVAMIYQELSLAPHLTVAENILLGVEPTRGPFLRRGEMRARAARALRHVGHDDIPLDAPAGRLPIAQQQLVEIARGVAVGARVLVLDEPTSSLGRDDVQRLFELVRRMREAGCSVLYVSHFLEEARQIADRFTVLRDGRSVGGGVLAQASTQHIVTLMVGREVSELFPRSKRSPGEVVISLRDIACGCEPSPRTRGEGRARGDRPGTSLELRRGEVLGIAGLVGAGRTELLRAIFGLDAVRSGTIRVGALAGPQSPTRRWAQGLGLVSEDRKGEGLALRLSVAENLTLPGLRGLGPLGFVTPTRQVSAARTWIERLGVRCAGPTQAIYGLSGGNQQKVALARLLHADCDVLLLDEPTRGIDLGSKAEIYRLIDALTVADAARAILLVSSYVPELLGVCDRVAVMYRGTLGPAQPVGDLDEKRIVLEATGTASSA